ncbi:MAG TPA: bifunctional serine/threonine-protein kinase/formylglycine-generating enzyme family protein [Candidatus Brocadiia bacterium]|nr:bifunctional serine/threonine-protein kinase/formylglycine-generating enzyme family protein [Candidatus Brocadiia bacterium]
MTQQQAATDDMLGQLVIKAGLASAAQIAECLAAQRSMQELGVRKHLGDILRKKGLISNEQLEKLLRIQGIEPDRIPLNIGGYKIVERLGQGGVSVVFKAVQSSMNRVVALKVLTKRAAANPNALKRFKQETALIGRLNHPNIVQGIDSGEDSGFHFFAMEFVSGKTLAEVIRDDGPMPPTEAVRIARDIASGLMELESKGIVHGDVKPGNIMLTEKRTPKIIDLGLAVYETDGGRLDEAIVRASGTAYYVSPEQVVGRSDLDSRADIYSLGITLFELLTRRNPFHRSARIVARSKQLSEPIAWSRQKDYRIPDVVVRLIHHMTEKDKNERPANMATLVRNMDEIIAGGSPYPPLSHVHVAQAWPGPAGSRGMVGPEENLARMQRLTGLIEARNSLISGLPDSAQRNTGIYDFLKEALGSEDAQSYVKLAMIALTENDPARAREFLMRASHAGADVSEAITRIEILRAPPGMVFIPEGECVIGCDECPDESPKRSLFVKSFYIDEAPVTNDCYAEFCRATGHPPPSHWPAGQCARALIGLPVVNVSWSDAEAYAKWAFKRLPFEPEWEKAARGPDGLIYPWGNEFDPARCNFEESDDKGLSQVGKYANGVSPYDCYDMIGNVEEWTADWYGPYPGSAIRYDPSAPKLKVTRGGSYKEKITGLRASRRYARDPRSVAYYIGFRCVKDV